MSRIAAYVVFAIGLPVLLATTVRNQASPFATPQAGTKGFHWPNGKRVAVSLSFDDARASQLNVGLDVINPTGVKVTFFVTTGSDAFRPKIDGWKRALASGHEIGNHTVNHPCTGNFPWSFHNALENYTLEQMSQQLDDSNAQIQQLLGVRAVTFAYPCGQKFVGRGSEMKSYVPLIGQKFMVGRGYMDEYYNDPVFCDLAQASGTAFDDTDYIDMVKHVSKAAEQGGWVIFVGHDIGQKAFQVTDTIALAALCKYMQDPANGVWVDTVKNIGEYVVKQRASVR
ncbi:MAG: polysaccharide deacetylase family protein [Terriglobia bacterium]|jgi:peptidoglycan/xylan/chitin deacetylase (PgdA/CDA1 family)